MEQEEIKKKSNHFHTALEYAYWLLEQRDYTEKALLEKLKEKKYPDEEAETAVSVCVRRGFVNDRRYGEILCRRYREKYGYRRVLTALIQKGISPELAKEIIVQFSEEEEDTESDEKVLKEVTKKLRGEPLTKENRPRISAFLARKGYHPAEISKALKTYTEEFTEQSDESEETEQYE